MKYIHQFLLFFLCLSLYKQIYANEKNKYAIKEYQLFQDVTQDDFWMQKYINQFPEILWLASSDVNITGEGKALSSSFSTSLFGHRYIEFDRTLMAIYCMNLILDGSDKAYDIFISSQKNNTQLSKTSFDELHFLGVNLLTSKFNNLSESEMYQTIMVAIILGDLGKCEKTSLLLKSYGFDAVDHDDIYALLLKALQINSNICSSFDNLPFYGKNLLINSSEVIHWGHLTHLEGGGEMFDNFLKQKDLYLKNIFLDFNFFIHVCDVAGALGHINNKSSLTYTENTHFALLEAKNSLNLLLSPYCEPFDAYNYYLYKRASLLGFNIESKLDRALTKLACMMRFFNSEDGKLLKNAINKLDDQIIEEFIRYFDISEKKVSHFKRTPTYIPAFLINLFNNIEMGESKEKRLEKSLEIAILTILKAFEKYQKLLAEDKIDSNIPLCFNNFAKLAKENISFFKKEFFVDIDGNIYIKARD